MTEQETAAASTTAPEKAKEPSMQEKIKPVIQDILDRLDDAHTLFTEISELFGRCKVQKGVDYFNGQADKVLEMKSWYDPAEKKAAKAARLRNQLARLEAEIKEAQDAAKTGA